MGRRLHPINTPNSPESPWSKRRSLNKRLARDQSLRAKRASSSISTGTIDILNQVEAGKSIWADKYCLLIFLYPRSLLRAQRVKLLVTLRKLNAELCKAQLCVSVSTSVCMSVN